MKKLLDFFRRLLGFKCPNCDNGSAIHSHTEYTDNYTAFEVYECDDCGSKFV